MAYPSLPSARRMHYAIDGTVIGYNATAYGTGLTTVLASSDVLALNEETPSVNAAVIPIGQNAHVYVYLLFPELVDLYDFLVRSESGGSGALDLTTLQSSPDTMNGADGTWSAVGYTGTPTYHTANGAVPGDWWRATTPAALTSNNTGIKGIRFDLLQHLDAGYVHNLYVWGAKHAGETPDDIIFLEGDDTTEWPNDDDWGDVVAGLGGITHTYYVKNTSATKTANTITVKVSGSDSGKWTVSIDNASFASSKSIASLAAGATQVVYVKFTPPAVAAGVYRPYAYYLEADVASWT